MGRDGFVDVLGWAAILLWLVLSAYFCWTGNPPAFQAVGVVGIAAGVGYFAMQRHATPHPYGALEIESILSERVNLASDAGNRACAHVSLLAKALAADATRRGEKVSAAILELASVQEDHLAATLSRDVDEANKRQREILADSMAANKLVERARRNSEVLQATVVVVATLQSGLGAYFLELFETGAS
jgi:hypothetical protein